MPNDVYNGVFLYAKKPTINALKEAGVKICGLLPQPPKNLKDEDEWRWCVENWGSDRFYCYDLKEAGDGAIRFSISTAWTPALGLWLKLIQKFKDIKFCKVEWSSEDGGAGVWTARRDLEKPGKIFVKQMKWDEGCMEEQYHSMRSSESERP
jgi:hypothetical protein